MSRLEISRSAAGANSRLNLYMLLSNYEKVGHLHSWGGFIRKVSGLLVLFGDDADSESTR